MTGLGLTSPVLVAAGCGGTGRELGAIGGLAGVGGFVTRTITLGARAGTTGTRVVEGAAGFVHATGLGRPRAGTRSIPPPGWPTPASTTSSPPSCRGWPPTRSGPSSRSPPPRWGSTPISDGGWAAHRGWPASRST